MLSWWIWLIVAALVGPPVLLIVFLIGLYIYLMWKYSNFIVRIFLEKPFFIIPRGKPVEGAEQVRLKTTDGLWLTGCYFKTSAARRKGVILFGLEFGSNRWAAVPYCDHLIASGYDVFTYEPRNQGDSDVMANYEPLQWLTIHDQADAEAAIRYLKSRSDADPSGFGLFGVSKGAGAGLLAAAADPAVRCFVTDGMFSTFGTVIPYMRKWIAIYSDKYFIQRMLPSWYYGLIARQTIPRIQRERGYRFVRLENALVKLAPRPLLMIHGGSDTYIKPEMAQALFAFVNGPKELWLVPGAKHNQAINVAVDDYRRRVLEFFDAHLGALAEQQAWSDSNRAPAPTAAV